VSKLGIFVNRQTLSSSEQLTALIKCRDVAESMGHTVEFIFPVDLKKIPKLDALFIRANTDPMNATYVAAKMASLYGVPVIDDPQSIQICADKVNMYLHLMKKGISMPETRFLSKKDLGMEMAEVLFSVRVEKVSTPSELIKVAKRFFKLSDWVVVQGYIESRYDWRVGVLNGELLYACRYIIPSETFKIQASVNGHIVYCDVESVPVNEVPPKVIELCLAAGKAIGNGLYGVDIKENNGNVYVIEVNDNPSLEGGEDANYPDMYRRIISYLLAGDANASSEETLAQAYGPYGFEGEYGLGAMPALAGEGAGSLVENDVYSYKIDFEK
jgi:glutathione synthase/RimK-type ligase-like ATP-grasp enzyme